MSQEYWLESRFDSSESTHGANLSGQQQEACSLSLFHLLPHKGERGAWQVEIGWLFAEGGGGRYIFSFGFCPAPNLDMAVGLWSSVGKFASAGQSSRKYLWWNSLGGWQSSDNIWLSQNPVILLYRAVQKKGTVLLSTSLAWPAVAGCSRAETFSQLSTISFAQPCSSLPSQISISICLEVWEGASQAHPSLSSGHAKCPQPASLECLIQADNVHRNCKLCLSGKRPLGRFSDKIMLMRNVSTLSYTVLS